MDAVHQLQNSTLELHLSAEVQALRQRRGDRIKDCLQRIALAEAAMVSAEKSKEAARKEREEAKTALLDLTEKGEKVLIGSALITHHKEGNIQIEPVTVMP